MGKGDSDQAVVDGRTRRGWYQVIIRSRTESTWRLGVGHEGQVGAKNSKNSLNLKNTYNYCKKFEIIKENTE